MRDYLSYNDNLKNKKNKKIKNHRFCCGFIFNNVCCVNCGF